MSKAINRKYVIATLIVLGFISFICSIYLYKDYSYMQFAKGKTRIRVNDKQLRHDFPLLVFDLDDNTDCIPDIVDYSTYIPNVDNYNQCTFLIPPRCEDKIHYDLGNKIYHVTVNHLGSGKEEIRIIYPRHGEMYYRAVWYMAEKHKVTPLYIANYFAFELNGVMIVLLVANIMIWSTIIGHVMNYYDKRYY